MSFFDTEKLNAAQKANIDLLQQVAGKLFESAEQLGQLQFKTLRASADVQIENLRKLSETRDPQAFLDWQGAFAQKAAQAEQVLEFNRKVYELIASTQSEIGKLAERQVAAGSQQVQELVDTIAKNAPAGAEPAVAVLRSALETAGNVYESAQKAAKQAAEIAENGIAAATTAANQATREASKAAGAKKAA